jgi:hypothetical protein
VASNATPFEKLSAGASKFADNPMSFANKDNLKYLAAAAGPAILAGANVQAKGPQTITKPGMIRPYSFDPYSGSYVAGNPYEATPTRAAGGGLMGMANSQFNFAQGGDPVVRMAGGGVSDADILGWFNANPGANDQLIAQTMQQANVTPDQVARATGTNYADVNSRYLAATAQPQTSAPAYTNQFSNADITDYIRANNLDNAGIAAATTQFKVDPNQVANAQNSAATIENIYRNVLGRDADPAGLAYWQQELQSGKKTGQDMYAEFLKGAKENKELGNFDLSLEQAVTPYKGYTSSDVNNITDEWVRNVLGREVTDADRQTQWYKNATDKSVMGSYDKAQDIYGQFKDYATQQKVDNSAKIADAQKILATKGLTAADVYAQTGKTIEQLVGSPNYNLDLYQASQLKAPGSGFDFNSLTAKKAVTPYGNVTNPGDITINPDGSKTVTPNIPDRPYGGFSGMNEVKNAYTAGGGNLGYVPYTPKTIEEFNTKYNKLTGGSKQAYDYLMGKTPYSPTPYTPTGEVMKPYAESVLGMPANVSKKMYLFDPATKQYKINPDYAIPTTDSKGNKVYNVTNKDVIAQMATKPSAADFYAWAKTNNLTVEQIAAATGMPITEVQKLFSSGASADTSTSVATNSNDNTGGFAGGGLADHYNLGGYSDGGRLLRGPGDGVSDSIPATIGNKRPARLADGEFVVPARIVSELGNGSTEAGARKLYAMMDRVQAARKGSIGKDKVAKNSRADKYLPA